MSQFFDRFVTKLWIHDMDQKIKRFGCKFSRAQFWTCLPIEICHFKRPFPNPWRAIVGAPNFDRYYCEIGVQKVLVKNPTRTLCFSAASPHWCISKTQMVFGVVVFGNPFCPSLPKSEFQFTLSRQTLWRLDGFRRAKTPVWLRDLVALKCYDELVSDYQNRPKITISAPISQTKYPSKNVQQNRRKS